MPSKVQRGVPTPPQQATVGVGDSDVVRSLPVRMTWARLLKWVFDIDIERCACGGKLKPIAVIEEILKHIGLDPQSPPRARARRVYLFQRAEFFECHTVG